RRGRRALSARQRDRATPPAARSATRLHRRRPAARDRRRGPDGDRRPAGRQRRRRQDHSRSRPRARRARRDGGAPVAVRAGDAARRTGRRARRGHDGVPDPVGVVRMVALLVVVTLISLGAALGLLVWVLRLAREERERSEARAAALALLLDGELTDGAATESAEREPPEGPPIRSLPAETPRDMPPV